MQNYLILENICKSYNTLKALTNFNLTCNKGEIIVLLGENGSGKSTLISILSGTVKACSGSILINKKKVTIDNPQKSFNAKIGVVFQHSSLIQEFSIIENMLLSNAWYKKYETKQALKHYEELTHFLDIDINPHTLVKDLSLGEQQLVELVRALWFNQEILLLDELTAHLTKEEVDKLEKIIHILAKKGCTILFITHKLDEAIRFADKIIVLQKGLQSLEINKEEIIAISQEEIEKKLYNAMFSLDNYKDNTEKHAEYNTILHDTKSFFNIQKIFTQETNNERTAIKDISFEAHKGEILGIAGFEGQGQNILAEVLSGQIKACSGAILLDDKDITATNLQKRQELGIFYVSSNRLEEEIAYDEDISINLQLKNMQDRKYFHIFRILWKNIKDYAVLSMKKLAISSKHINTPIQYLSGGNMQKVIVKRAFTQNNRRLVILHQPSYGIDLKTKKELHKQILEEAQNGCTFIIISSDIDELLFLSNRISIIKQGSLTEFYPNNKEAYTIITHAFANYKTK